MLYIYVYTLFLKDFLIFFLFPPKSPQYIVVYSLLWVLLVVARGTLPQCGLMSSHDHAQDSNQRNTGLPAAVHELNHLATGPALTHIFLKHTNGYWSQQTSLQNYYVSTMEINKSTRCYKAFSLIFTVVWICNL